MIDNLVSIIMPAHNSEKFIYQSVQSVLSQTYQFWELIVVDDGSTDRTANIIEEFIKSDNRVKYIRLQGGRGVVAARQKAIDIARGRYIAFLDSDDLWLPDKLRIQLQFMRENNSKVSCTSYEQINEFGERNGKRIICPDIISYNRILLDCPVGNLTVIVDRAYVTHLTVPDVDKREDFALWLNLSKSYGSVNGLNKVLAQYRIRSGSVSRNKLSLIYKQWNVYRNVEKLGWMRSFFHVFYYCVIKLLKIK